MKRTASSRSASQSRWTASGMLLAALFMPAAIPAQSTARSSAPPPAAPAKPSAAVPSGSGLPSTQPTGEAAPPEPQPSHVAVSFTQGQLAVDATNASLNQILRDVSHQTGISISGGVTDERVFGHYGPGTPAIVLASLLDGTASNMLLVEGKQGGPTELILTPREGGPTPPNPNAAALEAAEQKVAERSVHRNFAPNTLPPTEVEPRPRRQGFPPQDNGASPTADADPGGTNPNGIKTPQQIYQQLRQMQQQQSAQTPPQE